MLLYRDEYKKSSFVSTLHSFSLPLCWPAQREVQVIPFECYLFLITEAIGAQTTNTDAGCNDTKNSRCMEKNTAGKDPLIGVRGGKEGKYCMQKIK